MAGTKMNYHWKNNSEIFVLTCRSSIKIFEYFNKKMQFLALHKICDYFDINYIT